MSIGAGLTPDCAEGSFLGGRDGVLRGSYIVPGSYLGHICTMQAPYLLDYNSCLFFFFWHSRWYCSVLGVQFWWCSEPMGVENQTQASCMWTVQSSHWIIFLALCQILTMLVPITKISLFNKPSLIISLKWHWCLLLSIGKINGNLAMMIRKIEKPSRIS